jgi:DNA-binding transcriptional ArsR family regulator
MYMEHPMPFPTTIEKPAHDTLVVSLEPVRNAIASMMLVVWEHVNPGTGTWLDRTRKALSPQELAQHKLVIIGFFHAILPDKTWTSFPEYLDVLEHSDATELRDRMLEQYGKVCIACDDSVRDTKPDWPEILKSVDSYLGFLTNRFGEDLIEVDLENQAYQYVIDPPAMKNLIVGHLRWFWENHLSTEWDRVETLLQGSVRTFQVSRLEEMDRLEAARYITGQDLDGDAWREALEKPEQVIFVPNPHIGPYVTKIHFGTALGVIFGARQPDNVRDRIPELDRADIAARMSAISDDTRLRILKMISEKGEMRSQDLMAEIELSQPSISRYLTQLSATGYLQERRVNGGKAYALNRDRIEKTLNAVKNFLLGS